MERELPIYKIEGTDFIVDVNQMAFIEKNNSENKFFFYQMQDLDSAYDVDYDPLTKNIYEGDYKDNNYIRIQTPSMTELDPEGMALKYNVPIENIASRTDEDVMISSEALQQRLMGKLNTIEIEGHPFNVDFRMGYLRPHDDFSTQGISLNTLDYTEPYNETNKTIHLYDPKKHELYEPDLSTLTVLPKGIVVIELPQLMDLDPVGYARKFNWEIKEILLQANFQSQMKARTIPLKDSIVPKIMEENKLRLEGQHKSNGLSM